VLSDLWYKNAIFYSLDVETFFDSDGDGCGDFEGLSRRLDYLESMLSQLHARVYGVGSVGCRKRNVLAMPTLSVTGPACGPPSRQGRKRRLRRDARLPVG
jgi:hypothetical protein